MILQLELGTHIVRFLRYATRNVVDSHLGPNLIQFLLIAILAEHPNRFIKHPNYASSMSTESCVGLQEKKSGLAFSFTVLHIHNQLTGNSSRGTSRNGNFSNADGKRLKKAVSMAAPESVGVATGISQVFLIIANSSLFMFSTKILVCCCCSSNGSLDIGFQAAKGKN